MVDEQEFAIMDTDEFREYEDSECPECDTYKQEIDRLRTEGAKKDAVIKDLQKDRDTLVLMAVQSIKPRVLDILGQWVETRYSVSTRRDEDSEVEFMGMAYDDE